MIDYKNIRTIVLRGLSAYVGIPAIRGNQTAESPDYPFLSCNVTTIAGENKGTWQKHDDGVDRKLVRSIWSISSLSDDWDESVSNAIKAREWFEHVGRVYLSDNGIVVQSTTAITNRDNIITADYERKNGFDVVFNLFDEVENPSNSTGYIESAEIAHDLTN